MLPVLAEAFECFKCLNCSLEVAKLDKDFALRLKYTVSSLLADTVQVLLQKHLKEFLQLCQTLVFQGVQVRLEL